MRAPPQVNGQKALAASHLWDIQPKGVVPLRTGENASWRVESAGPSWVLRLTSASHRAKAQLEAELDFIEHLADGGLPVARPLRSRHGERVLDVSALVGGDESVHAVLFQHLEGRPFEYHSSDIDAPLFRSWGEAMARLHGLSARFQPREGCERPEWFDDPVAGCPVGSALLEPGTLRLRDELVGRLRGQPPEPGHYGMVHGDFERTNFVLDRGVVRVFDFDDCCRHWFAWDVACALWVFRNASAEERERFLGWFLEGYARVRTPDAVRLERFSDLVRLRTIALVLGRLQDTASLEWIARNQEWLRSGWSW